MATQASSTDPRIAVTIGFAASENGAGVAYAEIVSPKGERTWRVPFSVHRAPALLEREVGYDAVAAVGARLLAAGCRRVELRIADDRLMEDLAQRRELPAALALRYVRLGCLLNRFESARVVDGGDVAAGLTARARAEVALASVA